jgi:dTDP-4-dehydrorhamnose reductase
MKVLVVGHRAMLSQALIPCLRHAGFDVVGCGRPELDITQATSVRAVLEAIRPDVLINSAAYTAVDRAESEPEAAFAVNRDGVVLLARECHALGLPLIHLSTDYVFDGMMARPYHEDDLTAPLGVYGRSKWEGENAIRAYHPQHLIVRTAWLYGLHGANFVQTMLRLAHERQALRVVNDQHGCPTWTRDLARALTMMCQRLQKDRCPTWWGTYHFCGAGQTTWYAFAWAIFEEVKSSASLMVQRIEPIPTTAYPTPARRPANSVLDCRKIQSTFGIVPRQWRDSLHDCLQEWLL